MHIMCYIHYRVPSKFDFLRFLFGQLLTIFFSIFRYSVLCFERSEYIRNQAPKKTLHFFSESRDVIISKCFKNLSIAHPPIVFPHPLTCSRNNGKKLKQFPLQAKCGFLISSGGNCLINWTNYFFHSFEKFDRLTATYCPFSNALWTMILLYI